MRNFGYNTAQYLQYGQNYRKRRGYMGMRHSGKIKRRRYNVRPGGNKERKSFGVELVGQAPNNSTAPSVLNAMAAGTTSDTRIGDTIVMTNIMLKVCVKAVATTLSQCYRLMLIYDKQANKALPSLDDLFEGVAPHTLLNFMELDSRKRFVTVWNSGLFEVGGQQSDNQNRVIEVYINCKAETVYVGSSAGISSIVTGSLILVQIAERTASVDAFNGEYHTRIRFTDGQYGGEPMFFKTRTRGNLQLS